MKKEIITAVVVITTLFALAGCSSQPKAVTTEKEIKKEQNVNNVSTSPLASRILDWQNRNLGEPQVPVWLKPLVKGNSQIVKQEFSDLIPTNAIVKYSLGQRANRDEARVSSQLLINAQIANELKTYVVTAAAQTLNQGQMDIVEEITAATKVDIAGLRRVTDFWQQVETTDDHGAKTKEYLYYTVWSIDPKNWDQLVAKYMYDIIGDKRFPSQAKQNIGNAFNDIAAATKRENEVSDRDFQQMVNERKQAADLEMARIQASAQVDTAKANAEASAARYAAYKSGDTNKAAVASTSSGDIDWVKALSTAAKVIF